MKSNARWLLRYGGALAAVGAGLFLRLALTAWVGPDLPTYITFYPAVMAAALLAGLRPGLLATAATLVVVDYWVITPSAFGSTKPVEAVGMGLFSIMGVFISISFELYRRARLKAAAYDREQALRETQQQKEFLANVLEQASQPFAVGYLDGRLRLFNRAFVELTGYTAEELRSMDPSQTLTPPEWREPQLQKLEELRRTGQPVRYEEEYLRKDGRRVPIEVLVHLARDAQGKPEYYYSFVTDISVRKQAEEAERRLNAELQRMNKELERRVAERTAELRATSLYARSLIEASLDPLVTISPAGKITDVNEATELVTGVARDCLIGSDFSTYFTEPAKADAGYQKVLAEGLVRNYPLTIRHASGRTTDVLYHATVYRNEVGEVQGVFAAARDVTERKLLEKQILDISERERQRLGQDMHDSLGGHLTGVALIGKALAQRLIAKSIPEAAMAEEVVRCINQSIAQTRAIARGLCPVELSGAGLVSALREFASEIEGRFHISCRFQAEKGLLIQNVSVSSHLFRIVQEAVHNAIRHGEARTIDICLAKAGDQLALEIRDDGKGLPARLPAAKGLGLRTMKYRADNIGAEFTVNPRQGGGTVVSCLLPIENAYT